MNLKFFIVSTATFLITTVLGFVTGGEIVYRILITNFGRPKNEEIFAFSFYMSVGAFFAVFIAFIVSLIIIHKLGKRWGASLRFGSHPVLKLTTLSFFTYLVLLVAILNLNYYFGK